MLQTLYGGLWSELALGLVRNAKRAPIYRWKRRGKPRRAEGDEKEERVGISRNKRNAAYHALIENPPNYLGGRGVNQNIVIFSSRSKFERTRIIEIVEAVRDVGFSPCFIFQAEQVIC